MSCVDLHVHSTFSDGTCTPARLVELSYEKGLCAFALTDHDTISGIAEATLAAEDLKFRTGYDLEVIPGIEYGTAWRGKDIHIVGLYLNYDDPGFIRQITEFTNAREYRNAQMCRLMAADGIPVSMEALREAFPDAVITRMHFARYLADHGVVKNPQQAFDLYIGDGCRYFVPRHQITPQEAVEFTRRHHGLPVLAHPFQYELPDDTLDELTGQLAESGLMAIEVFYSKHTPAMSERAAALAKKYDLLWSGGSDFHGDNKPGIQLGTGYGHMHVEEDLLLKMKHRLYGTSDRTKIFFSDFDGTLVDDTRTLTPATRKALDDFCRDDGRFVLSSGRALEDVRHLADSLDLHYPGMLLSGYNGGQLYDCDRDITFFSKTLPADIAAGVVNTARECGIYCQTYYQGSIVTLRHTRETDFYRQAVHLPVIVTDDISGTLKGFRPGKCIAIELDDAARLLPFREKLERLYPGRLHVFMSNAYYMEIVDRTADKASALMWVCRRLGISAGNSIAAGDAENDISMIAAAGTGIAMCNGIQVLEASAQRCPAVFSGELAAMKAAADIITSQDNNHDGLAAALRQAAGMTPQDDTAALTLS